MRNKWNRAVVSLPEAHSPIFLELGSRGPLLRGMRRGMRMELGKKKMKNGNSKCWERMLDGEGMGRLESACKQQQEAGCWDMEFSTGYNQLQEQ